MIYTEKKYSRDPDCRIEFKGIKVCLVIDVGVHPEIIADNRCL